MNLWEKVANVHFVPGSIGGGADTWITWYYNGWYYDEHFDGPGGVRGYSTAPCEGGDVSFDGAETWSLTTGVPFGQPVLLKSLAAHHIGHALGLLESSDPASIMYQDGEWMQTRLSWDDIGGIQHMYGRVEGYYHLRNSNTSGVPDTSFGYYARGDRPVTGDWNADGIDTIGVYRPSNRTYYLRNLNNRGGGSVFTYGISGDLPVVGDWNGDKKDTIGVYRPSTGTFYLKNNNDGSTAYTFGFGLSEDIPLAGDWNEDGIDTIGLYRPSNRTFYLRNSNSSGAPDIAVDQGNSGDLPVVGDWNASGTDTIGLFRPSTGNFFLWNANISGPPDLSLTYGKPLSSGVTVENPLPVAGDWDGNGTPTIGLFQY